MFVADWQKALTKKDFAEFYNQLGNPYYFEKSRNGEEIVAVGNKLIYFDGDYVNPQIGQVIEVNSEYETVIDEIREVVYGFEKGIGSESEEFYNTLAYIERSGIAIFYKMQGNKPLSKRENKGRGRVDGGRADEKNPKRGFGIRFNDDGTESRTYFQIEEENADDINYSRTRKFAESADN